jgi:predicted permease
VEENLSMIRIVLPLIELAITFLVIVGIIRLLKWRGVFNDSHQSVFNRLVTELALPAVIFESVATISFRSEWVFAALIIFISLIVCIGIIYGICRAFQFPARTTGALVMVGAFGSTATFAIPLLTSIFGAGSEAVRQAVTIGTLGVALPFFTLGVLIAVYFGGKEKDTNRSDLAILKDFLSTPIFIAFLLGVVVSLIISHYPVPGSAVFTDIFMGFFEVIKHSADLLVWIAIGLMLKPVKLKKFLPLLGLVVLMKMIVQPALALFLPHAVGLPPLTQHIILIESAMPSGAIAAVLADRYGCDGPLAAALVVTTYLISLVTIPLLILIMG